MTNSEPVSGGESPRELYIDTWSKMPDRAADDPLLTPIEKVLLWKMVVIERRWGRDDGGIWESDSQLAAELGVRSRSVIQRGLLAFDRGGYIARETDPENPKRGRFIRFLWRPCGPGERADPCPPLRTPPTLNEGQASTVHQPGRKANVQCPPLRARTSSRKGAHDLQEGRERPPTRSTAPSEEGARALHYGLLPIREFLREKQEEQQEPRPEPTTALEGASSPAETGEQMPTDAKPFVLGTTPAKPQRPTLDPAELVRSAAQIRDDVVAAREWFAANPGFDAEQTEAEACKLGPDNPWTRWAVANLEKFRAASACLAERKKTRGVGSDGNQYRPPGEGAHP